MMRSESSNYKLGRLDKVLVLKFVLTWTNRPRYRVQDGSWPNHKKCKNKDDATRNNFAEQNTNKKEKSIAVKTVVDIMTGVNNEGQNTDGSPQPLLDLPSSAPVFHPRCGQLVTLSQASRTASRTHATQVRSCW